MRGRGCCYSWSTRPVPRSPPCGPSSLTQTASPPHSHHSSLIEHTLARPYYYSTTAQRREPPSRPAARCPCGHSHLESAPQLATPRAPAVPGTPLTHSKHLHFPPTAHQKPAHGLVHPLLQSTAAPVKVHSLFVHAARPLSPGQLVAHHMRH
jgi:hypothetical protein